jgi:hypothetical protein
VLRMGGCLTDWLPASLQVMAGVLGDGAEEVVSNAVQALAVFVVREMEAEHAAAAIGRQPRPATPLTDKVPSCAHGRHCIARAPDCVSSMQNPPWICAQQQHASRARSDPGQLGRSATSTRLPDVDPCGAGGPLSFQS